MLTARDLARVPQVLERAKFGWTPDHPEVAHQFAKLLKDHVGVEPSAQKVGVNTLCCQFDLSAIRLRGLDDIHCWVVSGEPTREAMTSDVLSRLVNVPGKVIMVLTTSPGAFSFAHASLAGRRCALLSPPAIQALFASPRPMHWMKDQLRHALPKRSLIPYDILRSATGSMFFGRVPELGRLWDERDTCFAVTGPGRAGKTSLLKQYVRGVNKKGGFRKESTFFIDLMECVDKNADGYAKLIARRIQESRETFEMTAAGFVPFLRTAALRNGTKFNLILDECDDLSLDSHSSNLLITLAKNDIARLVLCGRGDLFRAMVDSKSQFAERFQLIRLGPLDAASATELLVAPLGDLGLSFSDTERHVDRILHLTGCFPHLVQLYAKHLAEYAAENNLSEIASHHLDDLEWDYELSQYFLSPLQDLRDPVAKLLALSMLETDDNEWTSRDARSLVDDRISTDRAIDLCNELVISNILTWQRDGSFRLANGALRTYAKSQGYLADALKEARQCFHKFGLGSRGTDR